MLVNSLQSKKYILESFLKHERIFLNATHKWGGGGVEEEHRVI